MKTTPSGDSTCCPPMTAAQFRAKATGVGNTCEASMRTGMLRSQRVTEHSKTDKKALAAAGYPTQAADFEDSGY